MKRNSARKNPVEPTANDDQWNALKLALLALVRACPSAAEPMTRKLEAHTRQFREIARLEREGHKVKARGHLIQVK